MAKNSFHLFLAVFAVARLQYGGADSQQGCPGNLDLTPPGYEHQPGLGYYKMHPYGATWWMANQICQEEKAHLLILNSEREAEMTKILMAKHPVTPGALNNIWAWVGVHEKGKNGEYFTVLGEPLHTTGYTRWEAGRPGHLGHSDCAVIHRSTGEFGDDSGFASYSFICEIEEKTAVELYLRRLAGTY